MPLLVCSAQHCIYNNEMYCSKREIEVGGDKATDSEETCCNSFKECKHESAKSSIGTPTNHIDVDCEAVKCKYNEGYKCYADKIGIVGPGASECEETECGTFDRD